MRFDASLNEKLRNNRFMLADGQILKMIDFDV
jgi:hypothetical protein